MRIKHLISKPAIGKLINQDCVGASKSGVWLLDGISEVRNLSLKNNENAVVWFVNRINTYLSQYLDHHDLTIAEILKAAIREIREELGSLVTIDINSLQYNEHPSASIIVARNIQDKNIEIYSLGDCLAYLQTTNQEILIHNNELRRIEKQFQKEILNKKKEYSLMTHSDFLNEIKIIERLKYLRDDLYQNDKYHILNLDSVMISKGQMSIHQSINTILLMSDGFSRIIDTYYLFKDYEDLLVNLEKQGVEQIYDTMREIEQRDQNVQQFPRLRVSDDASLIFASLE